MKRIIALAAIACAAAPAPALAQSNNIIGKQTSASKRIWIHSSLPSGCQYTFTNAATTWNGAGSNATYVWSGYAANRAYSYNTSTLKNVSTASNTADVQVEVGKLNDLNALAETHYRGSGTTLTDGDVIINTDKIGILWCNPTASAMPMTNVDMEYVMLHELGHVWGLGHDTVNTDAVVAPPKYWGPQSAKRVLTSNDIGRVRYNYGIKP